jgi:hypothetical protein
MQTDLWESSLVWFSAADFSFIIMIPAHSSPQMDTSPRFLLFSSLFSLHPLQHAAFPLIPPCQTLKPSTVLLVNVAVALLLHPVLQNHGDTQNEQDVDANNAKGRRKNLV